METLREELLSAISPAVKERLDVVVQSSKLVLYDDNNERKGSSLTSIDFEPQNYEEMEVLLCEEGQLQNVPDTDWKTCDDLQQMIKEWMVEEMKLANLLNALEHCEGKDGTLFFVEQAIPCILHLEQHTLLKILMMLLIEGLSNVQGAWLPGYDQIGSKQQREKHFIPCIEHDMNVLILGYPEFEIVHKWKLPLAEKG